MKKQLVIIGIAALFLTVGMCGCIENGKNANLESEIVKFIGTWKMEIGSELTELTVTFYRNGSYKSIDKRFDENGTILSIDIAWTPYYLENGKMCYKHEFYDSYNCLDYEFSDNNKQLTFYSKEIGVTLTYNKI